MTVQKIHEGLNESNRLLFEDITASVLDDASWTITVPAEYAKTACLPAVKSVVTYGAGSAGARTATFYPIVNTGSALVGVEVVSYVETTGVLTLTNRAGATLTNVKTIFEMIGAV